MSDGDFVAVEVTFALPERQRMLSVDVPQGSSIGAAIEESGICQEFPEIDLQTQRVGVFGKLAKLDDTVRAGDRIEIYRPLIADPKEVRRQRAAKAKAESSA